MNNIGKYILYALIVFLVIRFFGYIMFYAIRFWYVSIPVFIYIYVRLRKIRKEKDKNVIDADFTIIEDDEDDSKSE
ncbi:MAG: hypothetical protein SVM86_02080 [Candidatus Cloacimonadota bacterium]|nr:hypothetical protein [Candidatus Cloacimonadota bacterium]